MSNASRAALAATALFLIAGPSFAAVDLAKADACIVAQAQGGQPPAGCIDQAHAECLAMPADRAEEAAGCFAAATAAWDAGIETVNADIAGRAKPEIAAIARIDAKYDVLSGQLACDRMEELALASGQVPEDVVAAQKALCQANVSALAYARLRWRGNTLP